MAFLIEILIFVLYINLSFYFFFNYFDYLDYLLFVYVIYLLNFYRPFFNNYCKFIRFDYLLLNINLFLLFFCFNF